MFIQQRLEVQKALLVRKWRNWVMFEEDPLEYIDLSSTRLESDLLTELAEHLPQLKTLNPYCWTIERNEWVVLKNFTNLRCPRIRLASGSTLGIDHFLDALIHCTTIESLTVGYLTLEEDQLQTILPHLVQLVSLTLSQVFLGRDPLLASFQLPTLSFSVRDRFIY